MHSLLKLRTGAMTAGALAVAALSGSHAAGAADTAVQPFAEFVQRLEATPPEIFVGREGAKVESIKALEEMRRHLLSLYKGVTVSHSIALSDQVFDCMPIEQQPGVRLSGAKHIADPPPVSPAMSLFADLPHDKGGAEATQGTTEKCEAGTIPMHRITLAETARFKTLRNFFDKGPKGAGRLHRHGAQPALAPPTHAYAHAYQFLTNYGGYGALNLWNPIVSDGFPFLEVFSLSQHWYSDGAATQTAEVGWQVYPAKYNTHDAVLFVYWTADGYNKTGCYNLECSAFTQINNNYHLGGPWPSYSTAGGQQYEVWVGYYLYQGNWWLAVGGDWVGYYPTSLYNGGQMASSASEIDFGGETAPGTFYWPSMGSGQFAEAGWQQAAYQRGISVRDINGYLSNALSLTVSQPSPLCFDATTPAYDGSSDWTNYFYFGGPGGAIGAC